MFDCMKGKCPLDYKTIALNQKDKNRRENCEFDKHSQPLTYNLGDFPGYYEYENIGLDNKRLDKIPRSILLEDGYWYSTLVYLV